MVFVKIGLLLLVYFINLIRQMQPFLQTFYPRIYLYYNKNRLIKTKFILNFGVSATARHTPNTPILLFT